MTKNNVHDQSNKGLIYYHKMYDTDSKNQGINHSMLNRLLEAYKETTISPINAQLIAPLKNFNLTTTYPGLLIGSGYAHGNTYLNEQDQNKDFKIGFFFDYTTGLPIIPGSSIKGTVRHVFRHSEYVEQLIKELTGKHVSCKALEKHIFEDSGDVFFDACPITNIKLAEDYITYHGEKPTDEPTPLKFLRVVPNVVYEFSFILEEGIISSEEKIQLIKRIILDVGLGARTNVGYGAFQE